MTKNKGQMDAENYADKVIAEMSALTDKEIMDAAAEDHADPQAEAPDSRSYCWRRRSSTVESRLEAARRVLMKGRASRS